MTPEALTLTVVGTEAEVDGYVRTLAYEPELQIVATEKSSLPARPDAPLGEQELVQLVISFAVSFAGSAAYDQAKQAFRRYSAKRPHMRLESPDRPALPPDEPTPPPDS